MPVDEVPADQADPKLKAEALVLRGMAQLGLDQADEAEASLRESIQDLRLRWALSTVP